MEKINVKDVLKGTEKKIFSTGFIDIDLVLRNVEKGSIITIGGRPAMGKTAFSLSIVNHLLEQNKKIFYFSPVLRTKAIAKRLIANKLGMNHFDFMKIDVVVKSGAEYFKNKEFYTNDKTLLTVEDIENEIKENTPDVVFIDYIQLLKMPKAPNYTDSINLAVQEIKRIAKETGVIFVILTQLSRALENRYDKRPMLSDIRNSSLLEEISDVVMMIYRDEYYNKDDETNKNYAEIILCKNDFGPLATVSLKFDNGIFYNRTQVLEF